MANAVRALLVKDASGAERLVPLGPAAGGDAVSIGRDPDSTIRVDDPYVSRHHARVELRQQGAVLVDLGSHNGSLLNGQQVREPTTLAPGDVIAIVHTTIRCLAGPPRQAKTRTFARHAPAASSGVLRVDAQTYEVWVGDTPVQPRLSPQEFRLLRYLYERQDRVCDRQELGDAIWGAHNWDMNMLHRLVHRLKEKVEPDPGQARYVQTVPGVGYRLTA